MTCLPAKKNFSELGTRGNVMRCESSGWFASISNGLTGFVTVQRASVTRCPASGGAPLLTGRFRHSISGRMIFAGATRSANVGVSAPLRAIPGKLVTQVPPGVSSRRWRRICLPDQLPGKDILLPLVQEYFKEDVGAASRVDICYFRENLVQDRFSLHCAVGYLTNRRSACLERLRAGPAHREKVERT